MDTLPLKYHPWSDRLAMDIALALEGSGETLPEIMTRHSITKSDLGDYNQDSMFLKKVDHLRDEVREKGMTFRLKAKAQAEELLTTSWTLIHSPDVSATVKADLIKSTVKWGNLEPTKDTVEVGSGGGVTIQINLPSQELPQTPLIKTIEGV
jgi:hypothetical protein|tara:strand:+ start:85 stop:540 length:456 start_codon:yes stop_codon:yes gene_type:complete